MRTLLLDGSAAGDPVATALRAAIAAHRQDTRVLTLRDLRIGACAGDFDCWLLTPGTCRTDDDNRMVAREVIAADLVIRLTPVTFGSHSSILKQALDHLIQNAHPHFETHGEQTRHRRRYQQRAASTLTIGWLPAPDPRQQEVFTQLAARNAGNSRGTAACHVITGLPEAADLHDQVGGWLRSATNDPEGTAGESPAGIGAAFGATAVDPVLAEGLPVRRAALLVGSPRTTTSNSANLASYLGDQLRRHGTEVTVEQLYPMAGSASRCEQLASRLAGVDLVVLAFPLYVDTLPAPVTRVLERLAASSGDNLRRTRLAALVNCGFPEGDNTLVAQECCAQFAQAAGMTWAGALGVGGAEMTVRRSQLTADADSTAAVRVALDLAAAELAAGRGVPATARIRLAGAEVPRPAFVQAANGHWGRAAAARRPAKPLDHRPYR